MSKTTKFSLSSFSILFIVLVILAIITNFIAGATFSPELLSEDGDVAHVIGASLSTVIMAPFLGFKDAMEICIFILMLGGFLSIVNKTGALEAGIQHVVRKLHGNELIIIPILMVLFSIGGTTFGMSEETLPFYALLTSVMVVAGFDTIVSVGIVLLGSGSGVLGSTVNPFATGVAMDALTAIDIKTNAGIVIGIGVALWLTTTAASILFVMRYAKKVKASKGSTILSLQEQNLMKEHFSTTSENTLDFTKKHKMVLTIFSAAFVIMIVSLIPWQKFGIHIFDGWTSYLTGQNFGDWYFGDLSMWFLFTGLAIAAIFRITEKDTIAAFVAGANDMLSVVLIIVLARGTSVLMSATHLDLYILEQSTLLLEDFSPILFVLGSYVIYLFLAFLIPSSSGLAYITMPIMGALTHNMGLPPEIMIMIFAATHGVINMVSPTSGILMGGLQMNHVEYTTWLRFMKLPIVVVIGLNLIVLITSVLIFQ
ncbi:MAG: hypothetical protein Q4P66_04280 [Actinomycetaceae bacterium]|nr:hypothetical protein [Actinomycetaceae bacterium]